MTCHPILQLCTRRVNVAGLLRRATLLATPAHATGLLPLGLPELDTAELVEAAEIKRWLSPADDLLLAGNGLLDAVGKRSGAVVHRRAASRRPDRSRASLLIGWYKG